MKKNLLIAAMSLVALAVPATPAFARSAAALDPEPISVKVSAVQLGGNPNRPTGILTVTVKNDSTRTERALFEIDLVSSLKLGPSTDCMPAVPNAPGRTLHKCGGWDLAPGKTVTVTVPLVAAQPEAAFGIALRGGHVRGESQDGRTGLPQDFFVTWPQQTTLGLGVVKDPLDPESVRVTARNTGTVALDAYSLIVMTPAGVTVTSTACLASDDGQFCEVKRDSKLAAGASDAFQLHLAVDGVKDVRFFLAPSARYTNSDTTATVSLG